MAIETKLTGASTATVGTAMVTPAAESHAARRSFWLILRTFDRTKIMPYRALRNAVGVVLPLAVGYALGMPRGGVAVASGALNVAYSDGSDPYQVRAKRMLASSVLCALAVFTGGLCGQYPVVAVPLTMIWAFLAGLCVSISQPAGDLAVLSLVLLLIYSAQTLTRPEAAMAGGLALCGGLLQAALSLALWPVRRYEPERRALGTFYREVAQMAEAAMRPDLAASAGQEGTQAQQALSGLSRDENLEAARCRSLLIQGERIRLGLVMLARLLRRMQREDSNYPPIEMVRRFLERAARLLRSIGDSLLGSKGAEEKTQDLADLKSLAWALRSGSAQQRTSFLSAATEDARFQMDALTGQLQAALDLARNTTKEGLSEFAKSEAHRPWRLRLGAPLATLRANLHLESSAFRHAVRLAVCVGLGDILTRSVPWHRSYWLPMTIVLVLKPEFTVTFSRGILRIGGTILGLLLATALFRFIRLDSEASIALVAVFMFLLRSVGAANYGIFAIAISALIVLLIGITGVSPHEVIWARGLNTAAGGALALGAYALWPTWESTGILERIARMLDAYRNYFHEVAEAYFKLQPRETRELDRRRLAARMGQSNLEASVDRLSAEPGTTAAQMNGLNAILASSQRVMHAIMALESGLQSRTAPPRPAFRQFADDVEKTFGLMAKALRGGRVVAKELPDLREDQTRLLQSGEASEQYALSNVESDRLTNSLNTLGEQVLEMAQRGKG